MEGMLLWYECDTIIREKTDGAKSLDDFCKRFFAQVPGKKDVAGYEMEDVVRDLKATADFDWEGFLRRRVTAPQESLPLDVVGRLGYRLKYADKPPAELQVVAPQSENHAADSLGLWITTSGYIWAVDPGLPGDKAGLPRPQGHRRERQEVQLEPPPRRHRGQRDPEEGRVPVGGRRRIPHGCRALRGGPALFATVARGRHAGRVGGNPEAAGQVTQEIGLSLLSAWPNSHEDVAKVDVLHDDWCGIYADGDSPATRRSEALPIRLVPSVTTVR